MICSTPETTTFLIEGDLEISRQLASALHALVQTADAAQAAPTDRQAARRAIEQATVVARLARSEGFGERESGDTANKQ